MSRIDEEREFRSFCGAVFRGELTLVGKVNFLEWFDRRYPGRGYGELAHAVRRISLLSAAERDLLIAESWAAIQARARREGQA